MERVSSSSGEKESQDITTMELQEHGVAQKSSFSDGILELGPSEEIHVTSMAKSSPPTNSARIKNNVHSDEPANLSSSTSYQSPTRTQTECEVPANSGKNCPHNSISTASGDTSPELHEHLHGLQQHDNLQEQCLTDKMGARVSVVNVNQGGSQYQSGAALGNVTGHARPVKYVENPSYVSAPLSESSPQPVISHPQALMSHCSNQTSEPHGLIQNSQEYNQMLQYQLQQQQQQQQQMLLHQQYQNQMLQLQNQYFQLQQQNQQVYQHQLPPPQQQNQPPQQQIQHHHYLQQTQQLQQSSYQQQQQQMLQQLHPGQQEQCTQLLGQEHQTQFQQHNYQSEESVRQHNEQGYQLQLQQYQVQQQQVYQQFLQQQNLQQQQAYQQLLLQNQVQQQPPIYSTSTGNHPQGQGLIPLCDKDAAGLSENHKHLSPEGTGEPNTAVKCRPDFSPRPQHHKQSSHRASRMANTSLSPHSK